MSFKGFLYFLLSGVIAFGIIYGLYAKENENNIYEIKSQFAKYGLSANQVEISKDRVKVVLSSNLTDTSPDNLLLIRYINTVINKIEIEKNIYLVLSSQNGNTIYQKLYSSDEVKEMILKPSPLLYMETELLAFKLKMRMDENQINYLGKKISTYPQIYISNQINSKNRTLNLKLETSEETLEATLRCVEVIIEDLNAAGGGIAQYNLQIIDENNKILHLGSYDLILGDIIDIT